MKYFKSIKLTIVEFLVLLAMVTILIGSFVPALAHAKKVASNNISLKDTSLPLSRSALNLVIIATKEASQQIAAKQSNLAIIAQAAGMVHPRPLYRP